MDKEGLPPSYTQVYPPTAPPGDQNYMQQQQPAPAQWNQQPQQMYPQMNQPMPYQPQQQPLMQQQFQPQYQQQSPNPIVIVQQNIIFGTQPITMTCPSCHQHMITKLVHENNLVVHGLAGVMCIMGLWCGCCCIPYCIDGLKDTSHYCGKCNQFLGQYNRAGRL